MNSHVAAAQPREASLSHLCPAERLEEETKALALEIGRITIQPASAEQLAESIRKAELVRIPTQSGHRFRFEAGHRSDLMPATIPK